MDRELVLCVSLSPEGPGDLADPPRPPIVVHPDAAAEDALPAAALVIREGELGWMVHDRATDEVKPLHPHAWSELAGWRLRLQAGDDELGEISICDHTVLAQQFHVRPGPTSLARPERIDLPMEEGSTRVFGRGETADHVIADKKVSREQLRLTVRDGRAWIEDLRSAWGTRVNGERIGAPTALEHGDEITIGDTVLAFVDPLASPAGRRADPATRRPEPPRSGAARRAGIGLLGRLPRWRLPRPPRVPRPSLEMAAAVAMLLTVLGVLVWVVLSLVAYATDATVTAPPPVGAEATATDAPLAIALDATEEASK